MGIAEAAIVFATAVAAKMLDITAFTDGTVIEGLSVAAGLFKLDMVSDFLGNCGRILVQLVADAFKGFLLQQPVFNDDSFSLGQMSLFVHKYLLKRHRLSYDNLLKD